MYTRLLLNSAHSMKFTVKCDDKPGWQVSEEEDSRVVLSVRYRDWHRVERAMKIFADKATSLLKRGWTEVTAPNRRRLGPCEVRFESRGEP